MPVLAAELYITILEAAKLYLYTGSLHITQFYLNLDLAIFYLRPGLYTTVLRLEAFSGSPLFTLLY